MYKENFQILLKQVKQDKEGTKSYNIYPAKICPLKFTEEGADTDLSYEFSWLNIESFY